MSHPVDTPAPVLADSQYSPHEALLSLAMDSRFIGKGTTLVYRHGPLTVTVSPLDGPRIRVARAVEGQAADSCEGHAELMARLVYSWVHPTPSPDKP